MKLRQYAFLAVLAVLGGFAGGAISVRLMMPSSTALAQRAPTAVVAAQEFHLVDAAGVKRGEFSVIPEPHLNIYDATTGRSLVWSAPRPVAKVHPLR